MAEPVAKAITDDSSHSSASSINKAKKKEAKKAQAPVIETFRFIFACGARVQVLFAFGVMAGFIHGMLYPVLAYLMSNGLSDLSGAATGLSNIRSMAFKFVAVGGCAFLAGFVQNWALELAAARASQNFRLQWFRALLRQDPAFFDVYDVAGLANQVGPHAIKYRRGVGRKLGEGVQFMTIGVGGLAYAFWSSWRVAMVVLTVIPIVSITGAVVVSLNQTKGSRAAAAYKNAGTVAYTSVSAIRTVLSLNAISEMIRQYQQATQEAYTKAAAILPKQGLANGAMIGSLLLLYAILTLYGTSLFYNDVEDVGCDPSNSVDGNVACDQTGAEVFGAMFGIAFAGQGISKFANFTEAFIAARIAVYEALQAIDRLPGSPEIIIHRKNQDSAGTTTTHHHEADKETTVKVEDATQVISAILPKYEIDATSDAGLKPASVRGDITFRNVHFAYPTRPDDPVLRGMTVEAKAGQIVAFVGPSGSGKSTIVALLERFYDPLSGIVEIDGMNVKDWNVRYLRSVLGYVGQEPTLFATTIRQNIKYGNPDATDEEIESAARLANAHDFILSFPDGYDTQVGDTGSQLSGGQKQRIAIARVLIGKPRILLLDEATSALDAESELVVQDALDNILQTQKITTVIIAHRLSTIRNADVINVIHEGEVVESGSHADLMEREEYYYRLVQKQDGSTSSTQSSRSTSATDIVGLNAASDITSDKMYLDASTGVEHIEFEDVRFAYPTRPKKMIFDGFNFKIHQGQTVALVGPSGQGKSSTVSLIERFYDPCAGVVKYLGHDLKTLNVQWYRDQIGYVGQEPTLFQDTIGRNIGYGFPGATQFQIEEAAKLANAHDFISGFPEGYNTPVGQRGSQLSGGQKQRIAIARALVKKPKVLILDEATSALDSESEAIVQAAIDRLMESRSHTVIVIAHRLSTIRNADKIAYISHGRVMEYGSHDELIEKHNGLYKRLFESSKQRATLESVGLRSEAVKGLGNSDTTGEEDIDWEAQVDEEEKPISVAQRARSLAKPDIGYILIGAIGAVLFGGVFPMWGLLFAETIDLLFRRVEVCPAEDGSFFGFDSCQDYWESIATDIREGSFRVAGYWGLVIFGALAGQVLVYWGVGTASERLSKRLRDRSFEALLRQDVSYFDKRSVGSITSKLQDDVARIHAFSGEPVISFFIAISSIVTGVALSFAFMWQFALLAITCIPIMGYAASLELKQILGEDESSSVESSSRESPGGIIVETLLNIRTVSALSMEQKRYESYHQALERAEPNLQSAALMCGFNGGASLSIQQFINALQLWFGGWLLFNNPDDYEMRDFLIANFACLFSLFGLAGAFQDISDRKEVEKSAGRIFHLLDRESSIDPLSSEGRKLE